MRRFRQELSRPEVNEILRHGKVAVWAVEGDDGFPYAAPINYVCSGEAIYIHCAPEGHKIDAIRRNPKCSVCVVDKDDVVAEEFTSYFRSVIAFGHAEIIGSTDEKIMALRLLCEKYCPGLDPTTEIEKSLSRVCIVRIRILKATGKQSIELVTPQSPTL